MAAQSSARRKGAPARAMFYVVQQAAWASWPASLTVLHHVPAEAQELGSFDSPNQAIDFAEIRLGELRALGMAIELVDPPYGLVGTG